MLSALSNTGTDVDTAYYLFSRRLSYGRVGVPRIVYASSSVLKASGEYFEAQLGGGFAISQKVVDEIDSYEYEDDSDLEDEDDAEIDAIEGRSQATEVADTKYNVMITDVAAKTWNMMVQSVSGNTLHFASLRSNRTASTGKLRQIYSDESTALHQPSSPKSLYRLADILGLDDLKERALDEIARQTTTKNFATEVFSRFSATFSEVLDVEINELRGFMEDDRIVTVIPTLRQKMQELDSGHLPHADVVLLPLVRALSSMVARGLDHHDEAILSQSMDVVVRAFKLMEDSDQGYVLRHISELACQYVMHARSGSAAQRHCEPSLISSGIPDAKPLLLCLILTRILRACDGGAEPNNDLQEEWLDAWTMVGVSIESVRLSGHTLSGEDFKIARACLAKPKRNSAAWCYAMPDEVLYSLSAYIGEEESKSVNRSGFKRFRIRRDKPVAAGWNARDLIPPRVQRAGDRLGPIRIDFVRPITLSPLSAALLGSPLDYDSDGHPIYIGSAVHRKEVTPCIVKPTTQSPCWQTYGGMVRTVCDSYEILRFDSACMEWVPTNGRTVSPDQRRPILGGYEPYQPKLYHALGYFDGMEVLGKCGTHLPGAHFMRNNGEHIARNYKVLCWKEDFPSAHVRGMLAPEILYLR